MKNKFQKLFERLKSENRIYLSLMSFLTLAIMGMLFQSFKPIGEIDGIRRIVEFDEDVTTVYSFPNGIERVEGTDLIKSLPNEEKRHVKLEVLGNNELRITNTILGNPKGEYDFKNLVAKVVKTNGNMVMYDYDGKIIETHNERAKGLPFMMVSEQDLPHFGFHQTPRLLTEQEMSQLERAGKTVQSVSRNKYMIVDRNTEVIVDVSELSIEIKPKGSDKPFDSSKTFYMSVDEQGQSLKILNVQEINEVLYSGEERNTKVITTFSNHLIKQGDRVIYGNSKRS